VPTQPQPRRTWDLQRFEEFLGEEWGWRTSAMNLQVHRILYYLINLLSCLENAFVSCKLWIYIWLQTPIVALPLDPCVSRPPVLTLPPNPSYATDSAAIGQISHYTERILGFCQASLCGFFRHPFRLQQALTMAYEATSLLMRLLHYSL